MPRRRPATERREVPSFLGEAVVPLKFFDERNLSELDLLDDERKLIEIASHGEMVPPPTSPPFDPFTAWVAFAYIGGIEDGGPYFKAEVTREQRLVTARKVLTEEEVVVVESIAIPKRYRELPARELEQMIRTADDYVDRMWAGCWLELIGWTRSPECSFRRQLEMPSNMMGELEETIVEAYARSIGVTTRDDFLGWVRVDKGYEANLVHHRLYVCKYYYGLNGPPPYEYMKNTVPAKSGWKKIVHLVPETER
jgi:hypothetical protein